MAAGSDEMEIPSPPQKHKHRSFTLEFKVGVVEWVELHSSSLRAAASHFGLDRKIVRSWIQNKEVLRNSLLSRGAKNRKLHSGRGTTSCELDQEVLKYVKRNGGVTCTNGGVVSIGDKTLKQVAIDYGEKLGVTGFKASGSWLKRWKGRCELVPCVVGNGNRTNDDTNQNGNQTRKCRMLNNSKTKSSVIIHPYQLSPLNSREKMGVVEVGVVSSPIISKSELRGEIYFDYNTPEHNYSMSHDIAAPTSHVTTSSSHDMATPTSSGEQRPHITIFDNHVANLLEGVAFLQSQRAGEVGLELTLGGEEVGVAEKEVSALLANNSGNVLNRHILSTVPTLQEFPRENHAPPEYANESHTPPEYANERHTPSEFTIAGHTHYSSIDHTSPEFSSGGHTPSDFTTLGHAPSLLHDDHLMMSMFNHRSFTDSFPFLPPSLICGNWLSPSDIIHANGDTIQNTPTSDINKRNDKYLGEVMSSFDSSVRSSHYQTRSTTRAASNKATPTTLLETPPPNGMLVASGGGGGGMLANRRSQPVFPDEPEIIFHEIQLGPLHTTPLL